MTSELILSITAILISLASLVYALRSASAAKLSAEAASKGVVLQEKSILEDKKKEIIKNALNNPSKSVKYLARYMDWNNFNNDEISKEEMNDIINQVALQLHHNNLQFLRQVNTEYEKLTTLN